MVSDGCSGVRSGKLVCGENIRLRSLGSVSRMARNEAKPILAPFRLSELFPGRTPTVTMATILNVYPVHSHSYAALSLWVHQRHWFIESRCRLRRFTAFGTVLVLSFFCLAERASRLFILPISLLLSRATFLVPVRLVVSFETKRASNRDSVHLVTSHFSCPTSKQSDVSDPGQRLQIVSVSGYGIAQYVVESVSRVSGHTRCCSVFRSFQETCFFFFFSFFCFFLLSTLAVAKTRRWKKFHIMSCRRIQCFFHFTYLGHNRVIPPLGDIHVSTLCS